MSVAALRSETKEIAVERIFAHAPETLWKALATNELMGRWLKMVPTGFAPVKGTRLNRRMPKDLAASSPRMSYAPREEIPQVSCFPGFSLAYFTRSAQVLKGDSVRTK